MDEELSMKDFEKELAGSFRELAPGDVVTGTVIGVSDTEVTVDLNYYTEGLIPLEELSNDPRFSIKADIQPGDTVTAVVLRENKEGVLILSRKQADDLLAWDKLKQLMEEKTPVTVKIAAATNAGVTTYLEGIRAFIPASKLALTYVEDVSSYVGQTVQAVVITVDEETKKLVLSVKDVLKEQEAAERNSRIARLPVGTVVSGTVEKITPYGAFVTIGDGLSGLVHISQISEKRIKSPHEVIKEGDTVNVKIIDVRDGKISLSMKAAAEKEEPAEELCEAAPETYTSNDYEAPTLGDLLKNFKL
ncbi:MAG: 30S ribosomal protein S1 [Lachnospiraceae bacterium]